MPGPKLKLIGGDAAAAMRHEVQRVNDDTPSTPSTPSESSSKVVENVGNTNNSIVMVVNDGKLSMVNLRNGDEVQVDPNHCDIKPGKAKHPSSDNKEERWTHIHIASHSSVSGRIHYAELKMNEILGEGCQAVVRRVTHSPSGTDFAMKIITADTEARKTLYNELQGVMTSTRLGRSANVCASYEAFYRDGKVMILMEIMHCGTLADLQRSYLKFTEEEAAHIACSALLGLQFLHSKGLIHRDIKPTNLLVNSSGVVKIADFGVSTFANSRDLATTSVGTQLFMSPERIKLEAYSFQCDIWSLGLCVAQLVLGAFPFPKEQFGTEFMRAATIAAGTAKVRMPDDSSDLCRGFIDMCTRFEWRDRPTASELLKHEFITTHVKDPTNPPPILAVLSKAGLRHV